MAGNPKLKRSDNGLVVEINSSPFTLGRSLSCNYVIPIQSISRNHCSLEKVNNSWILRDTSTNGTCINGTVIKSKDSPPLKDSDIIDLDRQNEKYIFYHSAPTGDISDEQLCRIADSLLDKVEEIPNPQSTVQSYKTVPAYRSIPVSTNGPPHADHGLLYGKKRKLINPAPYQINTSIVDLTNESGCNSMNEETEIAGPSNRTPEECTAKTKEPNDVEAETSNQSSQECTKNEKSNDAKSKGGPETDSREKFHDEMQCSICSEMFVKAVTLNCSHTFCKFCIEAWRKKKDICPICRSKITSISPTLVLDNIIEMEIQNSSEEVKQHRKELLEERKKCVEPQSKHKEKEIPNRGRPNNLSVIELSSDDSDSDLTSEADWSEEYDEDNWYEENTTGYPGAYYGGYGHCYSCGRRGHWANGCPFR